MEGLLSCPTCKTEYASHLDVCDNCNYPFSGTDKEKSLFIVHQIMKKGEIKDTRKDIKNSQTILIVIGVFNIIVPLLKYLVTPLSGFSIASGIIVGLVFIFFGIRVKKKPVSSSVIPLVLLIIYYTINGIFNPLTIVMGSLWKVLSVGGLIYCIYSVKRAKKLQKESRFLASKKYK